MECLEPKHNHNRQVHSNERNVSNGSSMSILNTDSFFMPTAGSPSRSR